MAQRHLESDRILKENVQCCFRTDIISQFITEVSRNMSFHHACSLIMNNPGQG